MNFPRILLVDDNPMLLQTLALGFRSYGFEVVTAAHGIEGTGLEKEDGHLWGVSDPSPLLRLYERGPLIDFFPLG